VRDQEAAAADITATRVNYRFGIADGDRRIDGVASLLQHGDPSLGGQAVC
jgi:hypothetical protein